ncbi:MAG: hypothetical protein U1E11_10660 [Dethiobacteria bacterium]|nr:hypothetical protein [Dethiobacteria bacterium]
MTSDQGYRKEPGVPVSKIALASALLGAGSILAMIISVVIAFTIEIVGVVSLFRGVVLPLSLAAVVTGLIARSKIPAEERNNRKKASIGLIVGVITFGLVLIAIIAVALLFIPLLFV